MHPNLRRATVPHPDALPVEVVERKGRGHPDTLCDALAEETSLALSRFYLERFGHILHHNVDKVLLAAGRANPRFGGGVVEDPVRLFIAGRGTHEYQGERVPVEELTVEACRASLRDRVHALDPERHTRIQCLVRPGSRDLTELFARHRGSRPAANDTSCGAGFAPASLLERVVLAVERDLTAPATVTARPQIGEDVKVLGVRRGDRIELTLACATVDRHLADLSAYLETVDWIRERATEVSREIADREVEVVVNAGDDRAAGSVYLTVTGTSAEAGDDGQTGRGNRVGGLITPYRPMTLEAAAGKNPVSHVGKLYSVVARRLAAALVDRIPAVDSASCWLAAHIGDPIDEPYLVDIELGTVEGNPDSHRDAVEEILATELAGVSELWRALLAREIPLF